MRGTRGVREPGRAPYRRRYELRPCGRRRPPNPSDLSLSRRREEEERRQKREKKSLDPIQRKLRFIPLDKPRVRKELELLQSKEQELISELGQIKRRRAELGEEGCDYYDDLAQLPPKSPSKWEMQESFRRFVDDIKEAVQYFKLLDYLLECDFLKHDSCPELIFSSGKLPLNQFPLLKKFTIIDALERFIHGKKLQFIAERDHQCDMYVLTCNFIKCDSDPYKIARILEKEFPDLPHKQIELTTRDYLDYLNRAKHGTETLLEEFVNEKSYVKHLQRLKMGRYPHKFQDPYLPIRNIVYKYRAENYVVNLEAEFLKYKYPFSYGSRSFSLAWW